MISNVFPLRFPFEKFQIDRVAYEEGLLDSLRAAHNATHSFFRSGDHIYISPMSEDRLEIGKTAILGVDEEPEVVSSLVKHVFFRTFRERFESIVPLDFYPFRILSRKDADDLLASSATDVFKGGKNPLEDTLSYRKQIEVQFRDFSSGGRRHLGAVVNVRYRWVFDPSFSCAELVEDGFDLVDRNVLHVTPLPGLHGVLAPDETLVGAVVAVEGEFATVTTNEGEKRYPLRELSLHKSPDNIREFLIHRLGEGHATRVLARLKERDATRLNAKAYYGEVKAMADTISGLDYRNADGFTFSIAGDPFRPKERFNLVDPQFRFDYNPGASHENASKGLDKYGPYDSRTFNPKSPRFAVICHRSSRNGFSSFLGKLRDGIPAASNFAGGMTRKYKFHEIQFDAANDFIELESYAYVEYERAVEEYLRRTDPEKRPSIVFAETRDDFRAAAPKYNPYYRVKARLMAAGIPTQFVKSTTLRKPDESLKWTCDSVALQSYAKMGGVPYVLPADNNVDREIVVGIGHASFRSNEYSGNEQNRVVGITTFFSGDGEYIFGTRCRDVPYEKYFDELLANLRSSLRDISEEYGWRSGDAVRIVFHVFKPVKNVEADVVATLMEEFPEFSIRFAFVTVHDHHPFLLLDERQTGRGAERLGAFVPARKVNWVLDERSCLVQLAGPSEMRTALHGFSTPLVVRIHERSTFRDLHYLVQQVYNFSFLSWRTFKPARRPVTTDYADQIALMLTNLRQIPGWLPETVNSPDMRFKKWFL